MSGFIINVDFSLHEASKKQSDGNQKHQRFVRRRRFLERKGFLKKKQLPAPQQQPQPAPKGHVSHQGQPRKKRPAEAGTDHDSFHASGFSHAPRTLPKGKDGCRVVQVGRAMDSSSQLTCFPSKVRKVAGSIKSLAGVHREALLSEYDSGLPAAPVSSKPSKLVAIDCEMVGTGPGGRTSDLARCSIVNYHGDVVYDKYIRPIEPIADYRTRWSGIRKHHMKNATPFKTAQKEVSAQGWGWAGVWYRLAVGGTLFPVHSKALQQQGISSGDLVEGVQTPLHLAASSAGCQARSWGLPGCPWLSSGAAQSCQKPPCAL